MKLPPMNTGIAVTVAFIVQLIAMQVFDVSATNSALIFLCILMGYVLNELGKLKKPKKKKKGCADGR